MVGPSDAPVVNPQQVSGEMGGGSLEIPDDLGPDGGPTLNPPPKMGDATPMSQKQAQGEIEGGGEVGPL